MRTSARCFTLFGAASFSLFAAGCGGPARQPDAGQYADQARLQQVIRDYQKPNGSLDPAVLLDADLYGGAKRSTAPVFDVPAPVPRGR